MCACSGEEGVKYKFPDPCTQDHCGENESVLSYNRHNIKKKFKLSILNNKLTNNIFFKLIGVGKLRFYSTMNFHFLLGGILFKPPLPPPFSTRGNIPYGTRGLVPENQLIPRMVGGSGPDH